MRRAMNLATQSFTIIVKQRSESIKGRRALTGGFWYDKGKNAQDERVF